MSPLIIDRIARAVLYEGYLLYPYRLSAVKNRQRWNFGVLYPPAYAEKFGPNESSWMQTECLIEGDPLARLRVRVRFLHLIPQGEQEAVEREVVLPECRLIEIAAAELRHPFTFTEPPAQSIEGFVELSAVTLEDDLFRITARVVNSTPVEQAADREAALRASMLSTHTILNGSGGAFVSLLETPEPFREAAAGCRNVGTWPVLAGEPGCRDSMLSAPIILYDYPQIAPESPGDLFDGTEIDEILSLRILTMTDDEKNEIRQGDERARRILERTETLPPEHFMKLHGALHGLEPRGLRPLQQEEPNE